ncbi:DUF3293 domain-containing protein [Paralcaligenes ginsengisoli]
MATNRVSTTLISPTLLRAYRETDYIVSGASGFTLRVGVANPALSALFERHGVRCAAFITAFNPLSRITPEPENRRRQRELQDWLDRSAYTCMQGVGRHPSNSWPGEPSFLVLGIDRADARALGEKFRQNAIVWCGGDAMPQLLLL